MNLSSNTISISRVTFTIQFGLARENAGLTIPVNRIWGTVLVPPPSSYPNPFLRDLLQNSIQTVLSQFTSTNPLTISPKFKYKQMPTRR